MENILLNEAKTDIKIIGKPFCNLFHSHTCRGRSAIVPKALTESHLEMESRPHPL